MSLLGLPQHIYVIIQVNIMRSTSGYPEKHQRVKPPRNLQQRNQARKRKVLKNRLRKDSLIGMPRRISKGE